jgi:hypothetical protein
MRSSRALKAARWVLGPLPRFYSHTPTTNLPSTTPTFAIVLKVIAAMKLANAFMIIWEMWAALQQSLLPTMRALLDKPSLIVHPRLISQIFMINTWRLMGDGIDENNTKLKRSLITAHARGVVLDIGAGERLKTSSSGRVSHSRSMTLKATVTRPNISTMPE